MNMHISLLLITSISFLVALVAAILWTVHLTHTLPSTFQDIDLSDNCEEKHYLF